MKRVLLLSVMMLFAASYAFAEEIAQQSLWQVLRARIEQATPQKKPAVTTAVGGVRGAKNDAGGDLYWKGENSGTEEIDTALEKFTAAVREVEAGNIEPARLLFEEFVNEYPESEFHADALLALEEIGGTSAP
jgi:TolA-binding protein